MAIAANNVLRVIAKMSDIAQDVYNVYHLYTQNAPTLDDDLFLGLVASVLNTAYSEIVGIISDDVNFDSIQMYNLTQDYEVGEVAWPSLTSGSSSTDKMPPQCAALVLFDTNTPNSQGRKFLPPFTDSSLAIDGTLNSSALADTAAFAADFLDSVEPLGADALWGNWNASQQTFSEWLFANARDFYATQRRRYVGSGS